MSFDNIQHIHCVGIGGIGLSSLARILHEQGKNVTGSDLQRSDLTTELEKEGITFYARHGAENLSENTQMLIFSEAVPQDNIELVTAKKRGISTISYFEALGILTQNFFTIAVCGTHGKTTTTALLSLALLNAGFDPTVVIGTKLREFGGKNMRMGKSQYCVVEACEYRRSFLFLKPRIIIITNIEAEHLDYYRDFDDYVSAFRSFVALLPQNGILIYNAENEATARVAAHFSGKKMAFGMGNEKLALSIPGEHNQMNAFAALLALEALDGDRNKALEAIKHYQGAWRRFEYKGEVQGVSVYDDYAHHPTEIRATLRAARERFPQNRIRLVFQPHQYSRTKKLFNDFLTAFEDADEVIIPNIYVVRDSVEDQKSITPEELVQGISLHHPSTIYGHGLENSAKILLSTLQKGDVIFLMGAGDVCKISDMLGLKIVIK